MYKKLPNSPSSISNYSDDQPRIKKKYIHKKIKHYKKKPIIEKETIENETLENKKYLKIINFAKKHPLKYQEFPKLKYKDHIYHQNDPILISNSDDPENDFIAILRKIMKVIYEGSLHIVIEVQWFFF